ncbi:MAG TPA: PilN domain-containing protein [Rhodopila sp.]
MLASFVSWWLARVTELLPTAWTNTAFRLRDGIIVTTASSGTVAVSRRRNALLTPIGLGAAARSPARLSILLHPPAGSVLVKHHTVPTVPRNQMEQLLRHELARITPFPPQDLFWHWDGHIKPGNRARTEVTLTMVPRAALAPALAALDEVNLKADYVEVVTPERPCLLPVGAAADRASRTGLTRVLAFGCASLAAVALILPICLQALALHNTDTAIAALQPTIAQVEAIRRGAAASDAGRDIVAQEIQRTGDLLQILAVVTRILPDDTYLTDFSLRERQMMLSGRSASAPRLITGLSADPAIRNAVFAAPVTRIEGATSDVFSIKAEAAK